MTEFRAGHASAADWRSACRAALAQLGPEPGRFTLGFFYVNDPLADDLPAIYEMLREASGFADWVGAVGYGVCGLAFDGTAAATAPDAMTAGEYFDQPAVTLLATDMSREDFRVFSIGAEDFADFRARHGAWIAEASPALAVVHGDSRNPRTPELIARLAEETGAFLVGGLASFTSRRSQIAAGTVAGGISGVLFAARVATVSGLSQGSSPLGPVRRITNAEGNVLVTLDGRPALDALFEDVGIDTEQELRRVASAIHVAFLVPGSDTGEYMVRNLVGVDLARKLVATGENAEPGGRIMFCARDRTSAAADLRRMVGSVASRAETAAKGALYFSCVARGPNLFGPDAEEMKLLREGLAGVPLAGFYANGEVSNGRLYGYTGVLVAFR